MNAQQINAQQINRKLGNLRQHLSTIYCNVEPLLNDKTGGDPEKAKHLRKAMDHMEEASASLIRSWLPAGEDNHS